MLQQTQQIKKDYRKKQQFTFEEREDIKARAYLFTNQTNLAKVFKTSLQNVNMAFSGENVVLMSKIKNYVLNFEKRKAA